MLSRLAEQEYKEMFPLLVNHRQPFGFRGTGKMESVGGRNETHCIVDWLVKLCKSFGATLCCLFAFASFGLSTRAFSTDLSQLPTF